MHCITETRNLHESQSNTNAVHQESNLRGFHARHVPNHELQFSSTSLVNATLSLFQARRMRKALQAERFVHHQLPFWENQFRPTARNSASRLFEWMTIESRLRFGNSPQQAERVSGWSVAVDSPSLAGSGGRAWFISDALTVMKALRIDIGLLE